MSLADEIRNFISYFQRQAELISSATPDPQIATGSSDPTLRLAMHKKILYSAMIDSLARVRYFGERKRNHDRFVGVVRDYSDWTDGALVSVPVLRRRLTGAAASAFVGKLDANLARFSTDRGNSLPVTAFDESPASLSALAQPGLESEELLAAVHFELFYNYRNSIVHEFREPGYAMELFADGKREPCYHSNLGAGAQWRLLYPEGFFRRVVDSILNSLEGWFTANAVNPYDRVTDASRWTSQL